MNVSRGEVTLRSNHEVSIATAEDALVALFYAHFTKLQALVSSIDFPLPRLCFIVAHDGLFHLIPSDRVSIPFFSLSHVVWIIRNPTDFFTLNQARL